MSSSFNRTPVLKIRETETAFKGRMKTYVIDNSAGIKEPAQFLKIARSLSSDKIKEQMDDKNLKVNVVLLAEYKKLVNNLETTQDMNFKTKNTIILPTANVNKILELKEKNILTEMEEFEAKGSGWSLKKIISIELRINNHLPLRGSSFIELPKMINAKKAVLNIYNPNDNKCFLWSILAKLYPVDPKDNPNRLHHYERFEHHFDVELRGIEFPVKLDKIKMFEKRSGISINVYSYEKKNQRLYSVPSANYKRRKGPTCGSTLCKTR